MLNKQPSKKLKLLKFTIILPLLSLFLWGFNTKEVIQHKKQEADVSLGISIIKSGELKIEIKKENTRTELENIQKTLKEKHQLKLSFETLEYNNNLISNININVEDNFGNKASYSDINPDKELKTFAVLVLQNKEGKAISIDFLTLNVKGATFEGQIKTRSVKKSLTKIGENPLYEINGKLYKKSELIDQSFLTSKKIQIMVGEKAIKTYGKTAKDGVIILSDSQKVTSFRDGFNISKKENRTFGQILKVTKGRTPEFSYYESPKKNQKTQVSQKIPTTISGEPKIEIKAKNSREELKVIQELAKKEYDIKLIFNELVYINNQITKISIDIENELGKIVSYRDDSNKEAPILDLVLLLKLNKNNKVKNVEFLNIRKGPSADEQIRSTIIGQTVFKLGENAIYYVNGKKHTRSELIGQAFLVTERIQIFLGEEAIEKYGIEAKDGVAILNKSQKIKSVREGHEIFKKENPVSGEYFKVTEKAGEYSLFFHKK